MTRTRTKTPETEPDSTDFVTVREASALIKLSEISVRRFLTQKKLTRFKVGCGRTLLKRSEVLALVRQA